MKVAEFYHSDFDAVIAFETNFPWLRISEGHAMSGHIHVHLFLPKGKPEVFRFLQH